jgi:hypothetical protein
MESEHLLYDTGSSNNNGVRYGHKHTHNSSSHSKTSSNNHNDFIFQLCYWIVIVLQLFSIVIFFLGHTLCFFFYDLTVRMGLQEDVEEVGDALVQVHRSFGAADTIFYLPLLISSVLGLVQKRRKPSLICTAASAGIHSYWSLVAFFIFFLESVNSDTVVDWNYYVPVLSYMYDVFYFVYGIGVLSFLYVYMDRILNEFH